MQKRKEKQELKSEKKSGEQR